jgi:predicted O-methyltransferase YrrM
MSRLSPFLRSISAAVAQHARNLPGKASKAPDALARSIERHNLPAGGWEAKGFEFWTFLSLLLLRSDCTRILELGSGRSTIVFAEYAKFRAARFTSIETNRIWYNKACMELRWQNLPVDAIRLVRLDRSARWYDLAEFRSFAASAGAFDFVLVDGPNEVAGSSRGIRNGDTAVREIRSCRTDRVSSNESMRR